MSERVNEEKNLPANGTKRSGPKPDGTSGGAKAGASPVAAAKAEAVLPSLGPLGMLRWAWTQLTSMRTALFLLLMLAVAAVLLPAAVGVLVFGRSREKGTLDRR